MIVIIAHATPRTRGACWECERKGWEIFEVQGSSDDRIDGRYQVQRDDACSEDTGLGDENTWDMAIAAGLPLDENGCLPESWTQNTVDRWYDAWREKNPGRGEPDPGEE